MEESIFTFMCVISGLLGIANASCCCLFDCAPKLVYKSVANYTLKVGKWVLGSGIFLGLILAWGRWGFYLEKVLLACLIFLPLFADDESSKKHLVPFKGVLLFMVAFIVYALFSTHLSHKSELLLNNRTLICAVYFGLLALIMHDLVIFLKKYFSEAIDSTIGIISSSFVIISGCLFCIGIALLHPFEYTSISYFVASIFKPILIAFFVLVEVLFVIYELKKNRKFLCSIENFCFSLTLLFLFGTLLFCG